MRQGWYGRINCHIAVALPNTITRKAFAAKRLSSMYFIVFRSKAPEFCFAPGFPAGSWPPSALLAAPVASRLAASAFQNG